jgi:MFS family permease
MAASNEVTEPAIAQSHEQIKEEGADVAIRPNFAPPVQSWKFVAFLFFIVTFIEAFTLGQLFAFLPIYLQEQMQVAKDQAATLTGLVTPLVFLVGLPLIPFWGVWADKYSRKVIIVRSAFIEAVVFLLVALSQNPLQLALSIALAGFQLGNTGVMLAALRSATPLQRVGFALSIVGVATPLGFAVGPQLGGFLTDGHIVDLRGLFFISAALSVLAGLLVTFAYREQPRSVKATGSLGQLAWGALKGVVTVRVTLLIFVVAAILILAWQMTRPFIPLLVQNVYPDPTTLKSAIGLVVGTAALFGALLTPITGVIGDRFGYRRLLGICAAGTAVSLALFPFAPNVGLLAVISALLSVFTSTSMTMFYSLIATEVPEERRSSTLNLAFIPLYAAGIIGPIIGAGLVAFGFATLMLVAAACALASLLIWYRLNQFIQQSPPLNLSPSRKHPTEPHNPTVCWKTAKKY